MIDGVLFLVLTYLLAAVPFGLVITTLFGGDQDLRAAGSGNIGATNVARVFGWKIAVPVLLLDMAKGLLPVLFARLLWPEGGQLWWGTVGAVAFIGHCWPVYLEFRGGKGVATGAGALLGLAPLPTLAAGAIWGLLLGITKRSSVAALGSTLAMVGIAAVFQPAVLPIAALFAGGVVLRHVANIGRLFRGEEAPVVGAAVRWNGPTTGPTGASVLDQDPAGGDRPAPMWRERVPDPLDPGSEPGV